MHLQQRDRADGPDCYHSYQDRGKACLFGARPLESAEHAAGSCPAIDVCIERLQTCKALYSSGSDAEDCSTGDIHNCFVQGGICVATAVKNCGGSPQPEFDAPPAGWCDSLWFAVLPVFIGALAIGGKR